MAVEAAHCEDVATDEGVNGDDSMLIENPCAGVTYVTKSRS